MKTFSWKRFMVLPERRTLAPATIATMCSLVAVFLAPMCSAQVGRPGNLEVSSLCTSGSAKNGDSEFSVVVRRTRDELLAELPQCLASKTSPGFLLAAELEFRGIGTAPSIEEIRSNADLSRKVELLSAILALCSQAERVTVKVSGRLVIKDVVNMEVRGVGFGRHGNLLGRIEIGSIVAIHVDPSTGGL